MRLLIKIEIEHFKEQTKADIIETIKRKATTGDFKVYTGWVE